MPVTVITTTSNVNAFGYNYQRLSFYAKGLHWLFYSDGTSTYWRTSKDGIVWNAATQLTILNAHLGAVSVIYDGSDYMHVAYASNTWLYYKRGLLNTDGTITWDLEQTAHGVAFQDCNYPVISLDSNGYPWISFQLIDILGGSRRPNVTASSTKDGTWTTAAGFPYELSATIDGAWATALVLSLAGGKMYCLYWISSDELYGQLYDGGWGLEETVSTYNVRAVAVSAVVDNNDNIHVVYQRTLTGSIYPIYYLKRTYSSSSWNSETTLSEPTFTQLPNINIDKATGNLYVFWTLQDQINFIRNIAGSWESTTIAWITGEGDFPVNAGNTGTVKSFGDKYNRYLGVSWVRGANSPYDIRYAVLTLLPTSLKSVISDI